MQAVCSSRGRLGELMQLTFRRQFGIFIGRDFCSRRYGVELLAFERKSAPECEYSSRFILRVDFIPRFPFVLPWLVLIPAWQDEPTANAEYLRTMVA